MATLKILSCRNVCVKASVMALWRRASGGGTLNGTLPRMCVSSVWFQPLSSDATKTLNRTQMVLEQRGWVGEGVKRMSELVGVPPSLGRRWCPAVSPAPCALSSPAAAASFPGTEPSSLPPLLFSDLAGRRGIGWGEQADC